MAPNPESGPSMQPPLDRDIGIDMGAWEEGDNAVTGVSTSIVSIIVYSSCAGSHGAYRRHTVGLARVHDHLLAEIPSKAHTRELYRKAGGNIVQPRLARGSARSAQSIGDRITRVIQCERRPHLGSPQPQWEMKCQHIRHRGVVDRELARTLTLRKHRRRGAGDS
jgi:hypothetical protein